MTKLKKFCFSILFCLLILVACLMNLSPLPSDPMTNFDKLVHCAMFFCLSGLVYFENTNRLKQSVKLRRIFWGTLVFPILFGGIIELIQNYLSVYRTGDWLDFLWNSIGATLAFGLALYINSLKRS